jgi:hypothetical protein
MFERMLLDEFITLHLIRLVPNVSLTKCSSIVVAEGAAKDKTARYMQGSEYKKADASRSMRSEHVDMRGWKRSAKRADRYIGSGFSGFSRPIVAVQVAAVLGGGRGRRPFVSSFLKAHETPIDE